MTDIPLLSQDDIDELVKISEFIQSRRKAGQSLYTEICRAILDSGQLNLDEWKSLRESILEITELMPHIELIIKLKERESEILSRDSL